MARTFVPEEQIKTDSISALRDIVPTNGRVVTLEGSQSSADGGTHYWWDPDGDPNSGNGGSIIQSNVDSTGVWKRLNLPINNALTDDLNEGVNNLYFTETRVRDSSLESGGQSTVSDLSSLLPSAPALDDFDSSNGVEGNLSFDASNQISGVEPDPNKNRNITFTVNSDDGVGEQGVLGPNTTSISGDLNPDVQSTDNHAADIFGKAKTGVLKLEVNGSVISSVNADLDSTENAINTLNANGTGFDLSAATNVTFANGDAFDNEFQRSGTWNVGQADLRAGYNTIKVRHEEDDGSLISETSEIEYILDNDSTGITFANESLGGLSTSGSKTLSGIEFNTGADANFTADISNVYRNTYDTGNAITFNGTRVSVSSQSIPPLSGSEDETKVINLSATASVNVSRIIDDSIAVQAEISDPVDTGSPFSSTDVSGFSLLIDNASDSDTDLRNQFTTENYRFPSDEDFDTDLGKGLWDSSKTIQDDGDAGYNDGVQTIRGRIEYPDEDFSTISDGPTGNPDYTSNTSGQRVYYGFFTDSTSTSEFVMSVDGNATLVDSGAESSSTDEVSIEIKLPSETGWLDINKDFETGQLSDGDGAFFEANGNTKTIGSSSNIGLTTGTASTANSFDKLYYRIRVPENWTGHISDLDINWNV